MSRVALITGAAGGIGRATVALFRAQDWHVVGLDRAAVGDSGADQYAIADLNDERSLGEAIAGLGLERVDALINNAAVLEAARLVDIGSSDWDEIMGINVRAAFLATRYAYPLMKDRGGSVVNVSSVHAHATSIGVAAYAASKGALEAMTRAAAIELAADGIRVNAVVPGAIDTPMLAQGEDRDERIRFIASRTPLGRIGEPGEIAEVILFLADPERSSFVTGTSVVADGGALARLSIE
jgi:NAD(P)-dependent dehydrogenase (short-subunit alcohol dehydrogenase family)